VIVTVLIALFPVISATLFGLQSADRGQHDLLTLHRASRVTRLNVGRAVLWQLAGTAAGFLSLLIMPKAIVHVPILHVFNLILTPIFMALLMVQGGRLFERSTGEAGDEKCRGLPKRSPLNHFVCAYGFALCYLLVRFAFARR